MAIQDRWAWCNKCQALTFTGDSEAGACPAGGQHAHQGSSNYALVVSDPIVPGQDGWLRCRKCQTLTFSRGPDAGACAAGGVHDRSGGANHTLLARGSGAPGQRGWRWCRQCEAICFTGSAQAGACPAGGVHDHIGSGEYTLVNAFQPTPANRKALEFTLRALPGRRNFGPTPLYLLGHNTNTIDEVKTALSQGANGVEIDITAYDAAPHGLCIGHYGLYGNATAGPEAPSLVSFLKQLKQVADAHPELALVMFDMKPPASKVGKGKALMKAIREHLTQGGPLSVVISMGDVPTPHADGSFDESLYDRIHADLGPRELLMIDEDSDFQQVTKFFASLGQPEFGYGNGTSFGASDQGAMVYRTPVEQACATREAHGQPAFVDAWTINTEDNLAIYLRIGVNAMICDADGFARAKTMLKKPEFKARYRLAGRFDNPREPDRFGYTLIVKTRDLGHSGTDAKITFKLFGEKGSASTVVDTNYNARMEAGQVNYVVLFSRDLGALKKIRVHNDGGGNGPTWDLGTIAVQSFRYGGPRLTATFNAEIEAHQSMERALV